MNEVSALGLPAWQNFYVIVGSAGAALIGIQFVVITLVAYLRKRAMAETVSAFGTPTVVHLTGALLVSALMSAPWPSLVAISAAMAICGLAGLTYSGIVIRRARRQTGYRPVLEDWIWYGILPSVTYAALASTGVFMTTKTESALFVVGGSALGLLLIGIHNAWDTVTHIVLVEFNGEDQDKSD